MTDPRFAGKLYLCMGGTVRSQTDGDLHYIPASRLPQLYNVDPSLCLFGHGSVPMLLSIHPNLTLLEPRDDGNYTLPAPKCFPEKSDTKSL